jgi:hypothetical protein
MFCPFCGDWIQEPPIRNEGFELALSDAIERNAVAKSRYQRGNKIAGSDTEYKWEGITFDVGK